LSEATNSKPLAGKGIVVTRPAHQAQALARLIEESGGSAILFPAIEIHDVEDLGPFMQIVDRLEEFDLAIFISPNAIERAVGLIRSRRPFPPGLRLATIGGGGVRALAAHGITGVIAPQGRYDSEALLEVPEVAGAQRVVIFRGEGGRELLGETLKARGARVEYAECYRRRRPELDPAPLRDAWARQALHAVTVTSSEGLRNLFEMVGAAGRERLQQTPLFAPHPRIAEAARTLAIRTVVVTGPGDAGLLAGLIAYFGAAASR
jgi:uroporphyrinogen-III synthase